MRKYIFSVIFVFALYTMPSYASGFSVDVNIEADYINAKITFSGKAEGGKGTPVSLKLIKGDGDLAPIENEEDILNSCIMLKQLTADKNGAFSAVANMEGVTGDFCLYVNGETKPEYSFYYATVEEQCELAQKIFDAAEDVGLLQTALPFGTYGEISAEAKTLGINSKIIYAISDRNNLYKIIRTEMLSRKDDIKKFLSSAEDTERIKAVPLIIEAVTNASYIQMMNEGGVVIDGKKQGIEEFNAKYPLDKKYFEIFNGKTDANGKPLSTNKLTEAEKSAFTEKYFKNTDSKTFDEVNNSFKSFLRFEISKKIESLSELEEYISFFDKEDGGLDPALYNALAGNKQGILLEYIVNNSFADDKDFKTKAEAKMKALNSSDGKGSSSGGSGGSGGGGGSKDRGGLSVVGGTEPIASVEANNGESSDTEFSDCDGFEWALESIGGLKRMGILNGTGEGKFEPQRSINREEMLAILIRALKIKGEGKDSFSDDNANEWYSPYLVIGKASGLALGKDDGSFGIGESITREDAVVLAYRAAKLSGLSFNSEKTEAFGDNEIISDYAKEAVRMFKDAKILSGTGEGMFEPKKPCSRAEIAKIVYTLIKRF